MKKSEVLNAWASILYGQKPSLSIEITRECPLRCPGCYAYEPEHLGVGGVNLRQLSDYKGDDLVRRLLAIVDRAYVIESGRVLAQGNVEEIVADQDVRRVYLGEEFRL